MTARAVVLLSGGIDSTTSLAVALSEGRDCYLLCADYGQRHRAEVDAAMRVADSMGLNIHIVRIHALAELASSALTSPCIDVPKDRSPDQISHGIPTTYVPARNTVLLSLALACAETIGAREIWTGFNVLDASGYPDCRPAFVTAFEALANVGTAPGDPWRIRAPLIDMMKSEIITLGTRLGVNYGVTHSCYDPVLDNQEISTSTCRACGRCDACQLRRRGFVEAGIADPTRYA